MVKPEQCTTKKKYPVQTTLVLFDDLRDGLIKENLAEETFDKYNSSMAA